MAKRACQDRINADPFNARNVPLTTIVAVILPYARCRCADCGTIHDYRMQITKHEARRLTDKDENDEEFRPTKGKANGDHPAHVKLAPPPKVGFLTSAVENAIAAGPAGIRQAQGLALKHAKKHQAEAIDHFRKVTAFLQGWLDKGDTAYRARVRFALVWRPRFLAALSMTNSVTLAARCARISRQAIYEHRNADAEFAKQWDEAVEHAVDMLQARAFQLSLEGHLEPVYYMGVVVDYVRKFDSKLLIEMLRAYKPDRYKTPGTQVNVGMKSDVFVLTEEQRHELQRIHRHTLDREEAERNAIEAQNGAPQRQLLTNGNA